MKTTLKVAAVALFGLMTVGCASQSYVDTKFNEAKAAADSAASAAAKAQATADAALAAVAEPESGQAERSWNALQGNTPPAPSPVDGARRQAEMIELFRKALHATSAAAAQEASR